jgi:hypothetical protein
VLPLSGSKAPSCTRRDGRPPGWLTLHLSKLLQAVLIGGCSLPQDFTSEAPTVALSDASASPLSPHRRAKSLDRRSTESSMTVSPGHAPSSLEICCCCCFCPLWATVCLCPCVHTGRSLCTALVSVSAQPAGLQSIRSRSCFFPSWAQQNWGCMEP